MKITKDPKGITLIALAITIIVLLILAGVSLNALVGQSSIINNAQKVKEDSNMAEEKEIIQLAVAEGYLSKNKEEAIKDYLEKNGAIYSNPIVTFKATNDVFIIEKDGNIKNVKAYDSSEVEFIVNNSGALVGININKNIDVENFLIPSIANNGKPIKSIDEALNSVGGDFSAKKSSIKNLIIAEGIEKIENDAFNNILTIEKVYLPSTLIEIGEGSFRKTKIQNIVLPNNLIAIGENCFEGCPELIKVVVPDSVTEIGARVFKNCPKITNIIIGNGVTTIGESCFAQCPELLTIELGSSVTTIGNSPSWDTPKLRTIYVHQARNSSTEVWENGLFESNPEFIYDE
ncbi:MAG: leucine-rich repeat domain-containing protein [Clostridia bacterium]|nr:leucine-rich repeat domain-containing protein [Clostridia bacterium]